MEVAKQCTSCNEVKPLTEYHKDKGGKFGVRADCKACHSEQKRQYYINNRDSIIARVVDYNAGYQRQRYVNDLAFARTSVTDLTKH